MAAVTTVRVHGRNQPFHDSVVLGEQGAQCECRVLSALQ